MLITCSWAIIHSETNIGQGQCLINQSHTHTMWLSLLMKPFLLDFKKFQIESKWSAEMCAEWQLYARKMWTAITSIQDSGSSSVHRDQTGGWLVLVLHRLVGMAVDWELESSSSLPEHCQDTFWQSTYQPLTTWGTVLQQTHPSDISPVAGI